MQVEVNSGASRFWAGCQKVAVIVMALLGGLAVGFGVDKMPSLFEKNYIEGSFIEYFPQESSADLIMLGTDWCPACAATRAFLLENGVSYIEYDVEKTEIGQRLAEALEQESIPVLFTRERMMVGFEPAVLTRDLLPEHRFKQ